MPQNHLGIRINGEKIPQVQADVINNLRLVHNPHLKRHEQRDDLKSRLLHDASQQQVDRRWDSTRYENAVIHHLDALHKRQVASAVIDALGEGNVLIVPEAFAVGVLRPKAAPSVVSDDRGCLMEDRRVEVRFTPGHYVPGSRAYRSIALIVNPENNTALPVDVAKSIGNKPDQVLLHELVHALLSIHCAQNLAERAVPEYKYAGARMRFDTIGEFFAILIANIYLSEKNDPRARFRLDPFGEVWLPAPNPDRSQSRRLFPGDSGGIERRGNDEYYYLVKDHDARADILPLPAPQSFHQHPIHRQLIDELIRKMPKVCTAIARAPARFNPIRDVLHRSAMN